MKIALLGDVSLNGKYDISNDENAISRVNYLKDILCDCDYVIANLETPLTKKENTFACKGAYLRSDPDSVKVLNAIGVTHVTLANNHIFDYGIQGLKETLDTLKGAGINYVGLNNPPCILKKGEDKALLDGFCCYSANAIRYGKDENTVKELNYVQMEKFLKQAISLEALPIASVHFGVEHLHYPSVEHRSFFRNFSDKYNYILHGNHAHAIQGYEKYNNSYLYYALGDLCFDDIPTTSINSVVVRTEETRQSYLVKVTIKEREYVDSEIITVSDFPDGIIKLKNSLENDLLKYSEKLKLDDTNLNKLRMQDFNNLPKNCRKRDIKFFLDRLNFKYIIAYLNGKIHHKKYLKIFKNFLYEEKND